MSAALARTRWRCATSPIYGYIYDVTSGRLIEVPEATRIGKAA